MSTIGPVTNCDPEILHDKIILCCGEDPSEYFPLVKSVLEETPTEIHEFRGYRFWKFSTCTFIWPGQGTACIEPLIWELMNSAKIRRIILIGTAGNLSESKLKAGESYIITNAYIAATALDSFIPVKPLKPRFNLMESPSKASIFSTDLFYGFSVNPAIDDYPDNYDIFYPIVKEQMTKRDLVDMEVGQFYYFCNKFDLTKEIEFLAIKGPANAVDEFNQMLDFSSSVLKKSLMKSFELL